MNTLIDSYLDSKKYAWAPTTLTSERHRLNAIKDYLTGNPETLWNSLQDRAPYTRLTIWTRVSDFYDWLIEEGKVKGVNEYKKWRKKNAKVFKNVYVPTKPEMSFEEAFRLINTIERIDIRRRALEILGSGTRFSESGQVKESKVYGKGSKVRNVYQPKIQGETYTGSYQEFRRALDKVGLKPHDLRKLFLTKLVEMGANEFQLCEVAGWNSIQTASSYIKVNSEKTRMLVEQIHGGIVNEIITR
jgi:site-specific recombinase XerC